MVLITYNPNAQLKPTLTENSKSEDGIMVATFLMPRKARTLTCSSSRLHILTDR